MAQGVLSASIFCTRPSFHLTVTVPSCIRQSVSRRADLHVRHATHLIPEVARPRHLAEEADLDNAGDELDFMQELKAIVSHDTTYLRVLSSCSLRRIPQKAKSRNPHLRWILELFRRERRVDDEHAIVGDHRAG